MNKNDSNRPEQVLENIPENTIIINKCFSDEKNTAFPAPQIDGKGKVDIFRPFPSIKMMFFQFKGKKISFHYESSENTIAVSHCRTGQCGIKTNSGFYIYLDKGDIAADSMMCHSDYEISFPLGYYESISAIINLNLLHESEYLSNFLQEANVNTDILWQKFCAEKTSLFLPACSESDILFSALYEVPDQMRSAYCNLKAQELILFLIRIDTIQKKELNKYQSQQIEIIKDIHDSLVKDLSKRFTIDELSRKYLLNTTTLKNVFKNVYGYPIAKYMKIHRIKESARLLRETDYSISKIAAYVGYESQGKFTEAFKSFFHIPPTVYRKQYQNQI